MNNKLTVSDLITIEEIEQWQDGDIITIQAGTGRGKSHFIKNGLYNHAKKNSKKILFLIHRTNCVDQFQKEIEQDNKTDVIDIKTYQYIEALYKRNLTFDFSEYQYIVCDEFHYFMTDAAFSKTTDMSLDVLLKLNNKTRIFMSATGDYMERYIMNRKGFEIKSYKLPIEFDFIRELLFFNKDSSLEQFMNEAIEKKIKAIFFIQSAEKAYELYKKFKEHAMFNCSKSNKLYKHVDQDKINNMLQEEKFHDLILITTTCMDTGVNIKDEDLKYIVCDLDDTGTLLQCIGRKRLQNKDDYIFLYVKAIHNKRLGGMVRQLQRKIEMAEYFKNHTVRDYIKKYQREYDHSHIVYDDIILNETDKATKKLNELMYYKCLLDITELQAMLHYKKYGYCKYLAVKLGKYSDEKGFDYFPLDEEDNKMALEEYLDSVVGRKLLKEDQNKLIEKIDLRVNGRQQRSYRKLNEGLEMIELPFIILPKKSMSTRYWIVEKIDKE